MAALIPNADKICTYAAIILNDSKQEITSQNLMKVITAAGIDMPEYYPKLFATAVADVDFKGLLTSSAVTSQAVSNNAPIQSEAAPAATKQEAKVESEEEDNFELSLFD